MYIVITHHREMKGDGSFEVKTEAHVFVSSSLKHDTYFVQHAMKHLQAHFRARGLTFSHWLFNTDGAASHFNLDTRFRPFIRPSKLQLVPQVSCGKSVPLAMAKALGMELVR